MWLTIINVIAFMLAFYFSYMTIFCIHWRLKHYKEDDFACIEMHFRYKRYLIFAIACWIVFFLTGSITKL